MAWCLAFRSDGFHCGIDSTATLMAEHDNQAGAQNIDCILDASQAFIVEHISRNTDDKEISEAFIKDKFGWHTRIGTTQYDRERVLTFREFSPSFGGLLARHSHRKCVRILIAVLSYVRSLITCFVRMLYVSRYEAAIAFFESRECLCWRNHWPIAISGLSSAAELVSNSQAGDNEAGYKLSFCPAAILN